MIGRTYNERGLPVVVLTRWSGAAWTTAGTHDLFAHVPNGRGGFVVSRGRNAPRNVLVQRADGQRVVRPFRGLRRQPAS
jgi:hypothetical protein